VIHKNCCGGLGHHKTNKEGEIMNLQLSKLRERERERYPTRMPSSISVGETLSPSPTTNCNAKRENKIRTGGQLPTAVRQTIGPPHSKTSFSSNNSVP